MELKVWLGVLDSWRGKIKEAIPMHSHVALPSSLED